MNILEAIILGITQGLTEFLPVSSSGHLVLMQNIFGIHNENIFFDTMLHMASLIAIIICLKDEIWELVKNPFCHETLILIFASMPAIIAALIFEDFLKNAFGGEFLAISFMITGIILIVAEQIAKKIEKKREIVTIKDGLAMGFAQVLALLPGVSRAGMTLSGGLATGLNRVSAAKFSFLMSVIIIMGSSGYEALKLVGSPIEIEIVLLLVGMVFAALSGYFAIRLLLDIVAKKKLYGFSIYVFILAIAVFIDQNLLHIIF